jgi:hypothetical protein
MKTMKKFIYLFLVFQFILTSCSKDDDKTKSATVSNIIFTGCTNSFKSTSFDSTCITIESNQVNYLTFTHKATEFCCESEKVDIDFKISGDTIIIHEVDKGPFSYCFCEHDISFNIGPLDYRNYEVKIIESENSYKRDTIMFEFNYSSNTNYSNCK